VAAWERDVVGERLVPGRVHGERYEIPDAVIGR